MSEATPPPEGAEQPEAAAPADSPPALTALLERAAPDAVAAARDLALVRLAGLSDDALAALMEVLTGECADGRAARARLDAAKTVLGSIGIGERAGITIATQVVALLILLFWVQEPRRRR